MGVVILVNSSDLVTPHNSAMSLSCCDTPTRDATRNECVTIVTQRLPLGDLSNAVAAGVICFV